MAVTLMKCVWIPIHLLLFFAVRCTFALDVRVSSYRGYRASDAVEVRLKDGGVASEGRVEVYYGQKWGTVCDDGFKDNACTVICRQLGFGGGRCLTSDGINKCEAIPASMALSEDEVKVTPIWIDDIKCIGVEHHLGECGRENWGIHNCVHKEDVGCRCTPTSTEPVTRGSCDRSRHRITPLDPNVPQLGRVEVKNEAGVWGLVCDDDWDDIDARTFCKCLGFTQSDSFRALLYPNHTSSLPMLYDSVECSTADAQAGRNLWNCKSTPARDNCDPNTEAAAVVCGTLPSWISPTLPEVALTCSGEMMSACFQSKDLGLSLEHFFLSPACADARPFLNADSNVCYDITMNKCNPTHVKFDDATKHHCHDVTYSKYGLHPLKLVTDSVWTRRLCCIQAKNATVMVAFLPQILKSPAVYRDNVQASNFTMQCHRNGESQDTGTGMTFPATVQSGEPITCYVNVKSWERSRLYLVVNDCRFMSTLNDSGPTYDFFRDKCSTTNDLGLVYYNSQRDSWGFRFNVPKFEGHDTLYVSCSAYVCDNKEEPKPYCDRSCTRAIGGEKQKRNSEGRPALDEVPTRKEQEGPKDEEKVPQEELRYLTDDAGVTKPPVQHQVDGNILKGPFEIIDNGKGPIIDKDGELHNVNARGEGLAVYAGDAGRPVYKLAMLVLALFLVWVAVFETGVWNRLM